VQIALPARQGISVNALSAVWQQQDWLWGDFGISNFGGLSGSIMNQSVDTSSGPHVRRRPVHTSSMYITLLLSFILFSPL
jgi:hypothetical protein